MKVSKNHSKLKGNLLSRKTRDLMGLKTTLRQRRDFINILPTLNKNSEAENNDYLRTMGIASCCKTLQTKNLNPSVISWSKIGWMYKFNL